MQLNNIHFNLSPKALDCWKPGQTVAASAGENTINILDFIGEDYWTGEGITSKSINKALTDMKGADVTVNINSPGGSMFEGLAIYNLLREHPGKVTVKVLSIAASAASIIAMAGDEIQVAKSGFIMIHNAWVYAAGNRIELRDVADYLEPFDNSLADIYADRTGLKKDEVVSLMDAETYISSQDAIDQGFADSLLNSDTIKETQNQQARAAAVLDVALAKVGMPRSERRKLLNEVKSGTRNATGDSTRNATEDCLATGEATALSSNLLGVLPCLN